MQESSRACHALCSICASLEETSSEFLTSKVMQHRFVPWSPAFPSLSYVLRSAPCSRSTVYDLGIIRADDGDQTGTRALRKTADVPDPVVFLIRARNFSMSIKSGT
jgi:hypothetical protein